jgi:hypothetical protein
MLLKLTDRQQVFSRDVYVQRICYRMASADLARARKLAETVGDPYYKARAYGVMAQALAKSKPKEALALLDVAYDLLAKQVATGQDRFNGFQNAAVIAGIMLPIVEEVDPGLVREFFWRTLSLRGSATPGGAEAQGGMETVAVGAMALVLVRYDREFALALVNEADEKGRVEYFSRPNHFLTAAIGDPRRAVALVEKLPDDQNKDYVCESVVNMLIADGESVWRAVHRALGQWYVDDEDL